MSDIQHARQKALEKAVRAAVLDLFEHMGATSFELPIDATLTIAAGPNAHAWAPAAPVAGRALATDEQIVAAFRDSGMRVELGGSPYSVKGQIAQLINGFRALAATQPAESPAAGEGLDLCEYIVVQKAGETPRLKGPYRAGQDMKAMEDMVRETYRLYPDAVVMVATLPRSHCPQHGYEFLDMHGDRRKRHPRHEKSAPSPATDALDAVWKELLEKDDRNSPPEYPGMALITFDELRRIIDAAEQVKP